MKRLLFKSAALIFALVLIGCSGNKNLINEKNMQITDLEQRVDSLNSELRSTNDEMMDIRSELEQKLAEARKDLEVCLETKNDLLKIKIPDAVSFNFGSTRLTDNGKEAIDKIWEVLQDHPDRRILIEGHTDDVEIDEDFRHIFPSNWELSTARASVVLHYLLRKHNVDPKRIAISGYGEYHPAAGNDTPEGRAKNRRVVISVRDRYRE
ncbi:MAG: flagellar motor protein MotB [Candidatus Krumholzibacteriales bacterium]